MYRYRKIPDHFPISKEHKHPIIFLSGLTLRWGFLKHLADTLSHDDYPVYVVPDLKNSILAIPACAEKVNEIIDKNNLKDVTIVGFSKGGLIGKYLLAHFNSDERIKKVIAIATPFSGTSLARFFPIKSFMEVGAKAKIIKDLTQHKNINKKIISIYPSFDNHVWPQGGSFLPGAKNIELKVKGHHRIIFDKETQRLIVDCIEHL